MFIYLTPARHTSQDLSARTGDPSGLALAICGFFDFRSCQPLHLDAGRAMVMGTVEYLAMRVHLQ